MLKLRTTPISPAKALPCKCYHACLSRLVIS